jgi:hypothetical protein
MVLATFAVAVLAVLGLGYTDAELLTIVNKELTPEISIAAGANLGEYFFDTYTQEQLGDLVHYGLTPGIKKAAEEALKKYRIFCHAISDLLTEYADDLDGLKALGATDLLAAKAYYFAIRGSVDAESLAADAAGNGTLALAAGELLGGYYSPGSFNTISADEALDLAMNGEFKGLKLAGGIALATYILTGGSDFGADLTDVELQAAAVAATGWDPGMAYIYQVLLTQRFAG